MKIVKIILVFAVALNCESSTLKNLEDVDAFTESPEISSTEEVVTEEILEEITEELYESAKPDETPAAGIKRGFFFLLSLTIDEKWNDDFFSRSSEVFKTLDTHLGAELIDFVDNSVEATEVNTTNFKLIEVLPSRDSKLYVTFVMTSKTELDGEVLFNAITNKIITYQEIYDYKATIDGFVLRNIDEKTVEILTEEAKTEICDPIGEKSFRI